METRNTLQQAIVQDHLHRLGNHPTANQVYESVTAEHPSISKATVYRILNKMVSANDALRVPTADGADHFDHQTHDHYHIQCVSCGKVDDVELDLTQDLTQSAKACNGFSITGYSLLFQGVCTECQQKASN